MTWGYLRSIVLPSVATGWLSKGFAKRHAHVFDVLESCFLCNRIDGKIGLLQEFLDASEPDHRDHRMRRFADCTDKTGFKHSAG